MLLLILDTGGKDWIQPNRDAQSDSNRNISVHRRTANQVAEDLRRIRDCYYLERRNVF